MRAHAHSRPEADQVVKPVRDPVVRRPHPAADSLDELRGPTSGSVRLPVTVDRGPAREYDVDDAHAAIRLYSRILHEASTAQGPCRASQRAATHTAVAVAEPSQPGLCSSGRIGSRS